MILVIISQMVMFYDDTRVNLTEILYIKENLPSVAQNAVSTAPGGQNPNISLTKCDFCDLKKLLMIQI